MQRLSSATNERREGGFVSSHYGRWVVVAAALVSLLALMQWAMVTTRWPAPTTLRVIDGTIEGVRFNSLFWEAGVRPGNHLLSPVGSAEIMVRTQEGSVVRLDANPPASLPAYAFWWMLVGAVPWILVGGVIFVLARDTAAAALLWANGAATLLAFGNIPGIAQSIGGSALAVIGIVCFGGALLTLFVHFPINRARSMVFGRLVLIANHSFTALTAVIAAVLVLTDLSLYLSTAALERYHAAAYGLLTVQIAVTCALALWALFDARQTLGLRVPLLLVILGTVGGLGPLCVLTFAPKALGIAPPLDPMVGVFSTPLFPVGIGAAILSRQFFGITRLVRRSLVALLVWVALVGGYTTVFALLWNLIGGARLGEPAPLALFVIGVALVAATFPLAQTHLRRRLEALLFGDVYAYADTLRQLSDEIAGLSGVDATAHHVLTRLGTTLDLSWAAITLEREGSFLRFRWATPDDQHEAAILQLPLVADGARIGVVQLGPKRRDVELLPADRELVGTLAPLLARALKGGLLLHRLELQVQTLAAREQDLAALSERLMTVQEEERRRIALDLHDDPLQRAILLERALASAPAGTERQAWQAIVGEIVLSLRAISSGLRPPVLDDFGLAAGIERLVNDLRGQTDAAVSFTTRTPTGGPFGRLNPELETALYRVAQEAMHNSLKHANPATIIVELWQCAGQVGLRVTDDGSGLGPDRAPAVGGMGVIGMRERLRRWGGEVRVEPGAGGGTVVIVVVPVER